MENRAGHSAGIPQGAPILSVSGTLLGIAIEPREGDFAGGIPITELRDLIASTGTGGAPNLDRQGRPALRDQGAASQQAEAAAGAAKAAAAKPAEPVPPSAPKSAEQPPPAAAKPAEQLPPAAAKPAEQPPPAVTKPGSDQPSRPVPQDQGAATPPANKAPGGAAKAAAAKAPDRLIPARERNPAELSPIDQWKLRIAADPKNADLRFAFAEALAIGGLYREAVAVLQQAMGDFPSDTQVYWHLAQLYWQQGTRKPDGTPRNGMDRAAYRNCVTALEAFLARAPDGPHAAEARALLNALRQTKR